MRHCKQRFSHRPPVGPLVILATLYFMNWTPASFIGAALLYHQHRRGNLATLVDHLTSNPILLVAIALLSPVKLAYIAVPFLFRLFMKSNSEEKLESLSQSVTESIRETMNHLPETLRDFDLKSSPNSPLIEESESHYNISVLLPGFSQDEVDVQIHGKRFILVATPKTPSTLVPGVVKVEKLLDSDLLLDGTIAKLEKGVFSVQLAKRKGVEIPILGQ